MEDDERGPTRAQTWIAGGGVVVAVALGGIFLKVEQDVSAIQRSQEDAHETIHDLAERNDRATQTGIANATIIAENKAELAATNQTILQLRLQLDQGRSERMSVDTALGARVDALGESIANRISGLEARVSELQRQIAALEGKLGESLPNVDLRPLQRNDGK